MKFTLSGSLEDNWLDDGWPAPFKPAVLWASLVVGDSTRGGGGAVKLLGLLTNAPCCAVKTENLDSCLQFKHCCLTEGKLVKIPNSQITQPRQVTSVLAHLPFNYILTNFSTKDPWKQNTNTTI